MRELSAISRERSAGALLASRARARGEAHRRVAVDLTPQAVERSPPGSCSCCARREAQGEPELLSAGELARRLRVERPWVYRHRAAARRAADRRGAEGAVAL